QICLAYDLGLKVYDLALDHPTGDITREPALDERSCAATIPFGMEAIAGGVDLLCIGEMGLGNTTIAAAILPALFGRARRGLGRPRTGSGPAPDSMSPAWRGNATPSRRRSSTTAPISLIRSKSSAVSADAKWRP